MCESELSTSYAKAFESYRLTNMQTAYTALKLYRPTPTTSASRVVSQSELSRLQISVYI